MQMELKLGRRDLLARVLPAKRIHRLLEQRVAQALRSWCKTRTPLPEASLYQSSLSQSDLISVKGTSLILRTAER